MDEKTEIGISRRRMLKRIGAGAAIAWSAPVLTSLRLPAFAQAISGACTAPCGGFENCGTAPFHAPANTCHCHYTAESATECRCFNNARCNSVPSCVTSADCPPGWHCLGNTLGCHDNKCLPDCGTEPVVATQVDAVDPPNATVFPG